MKKRLIRIALLILLVLFPSVFYGQVAVRSYFRIQTTGLSSQGSFADLAPGAITVEWYKDGVLKIKVGAIYCLTFIYKGTSNGNLFYEFSHSAAITMPGTEYQGVLISKDFAWMNVYYMFGLGYYNKIQMVTEYKYLGDGSHTANEFNSDIYNNRNETTTHKCRVCKGTGKKIKEDYLGGSKEKWCNICGRTVYITHKHISCVNCDGTGKVKY